MSVRRNVVAGVLLCIVLTSCTSLGTIDKDVGSLSAGETIYVLGVSPENNRVRVTAGEIQYGLFKPNQWALPRVYGSPTNRYLIWKGNASDIAAITMVTFVDEKADLFGMAFVPCGDTNTMVFRADQQGSVVYLGDVSFELQGIHLSVRHGDDFIRARAYVERRFPQFKGQIVHGSYELLPTSQLCTRTTRLIPSYIPRGRQ